MSYSSPKDSSSSSAAAYDAEELLRLVEEDRAESAPPQKEPPMTDDPDQQLKMLASVVCMPRWSVAAQYVVARTRAEHSDLELDLLQDGRTLRNMSADYLRRIAEALADTSPVLSVAWRLLALRPNETRKRIEIVVKVARRMLSGSKGNMSDALERLKIWDDVAAGLYDGDDLFRIAEMETQPPSSGMPACVELLSQDRWDEAFEWLCTETADRCERLGIGHPLKHADRRKQAALIRGHVNKLFAQQREWCGEMALAWQMMMCDPRRPETFNAVLPQVTWLMNHRSVIVSITEKAHLQNRLKIWWQAARGEYSTSEVSIFRIAERETAGKSYDVEDEPMPETEEEQTPAPAQPSAPSVIVLRKDRAEERGLPLAWKDLRDVALPLVICDDAWRVREQLQHEYPHAWREIAMLTQDLRSGEPARMKPTLLLSQPGTGKTRLVRRYAELIAPPGATSSPQMYVSRFDAASSFDGMYSGTPKGWSSAQASVPARAIMMSKTANPLCLTDEICKAGESSHNGNLWSAITPHLEKETARNYPESGIDAVLDLSHCLHIATANSVEKLPSQLRDRYRVIRIPAPTLAHLPRLAAIIVNEMAVEDLAWASYAIDPLAPDELEIIGRAWAREKFSMRKLQRLVAATLEARDMCARRH